MKKTKWAIVGCGIVVFCVIVYFIQNMLNKPTTTNNVSYENMSTHSNPNLNKIPTKKLTLKNITVDLIVVQNPDESIWGLSDFPSLPSNTGMLFMFPEPGFYSFWMKDMNFSLDMIWLDRDNRVVTIHENISPDTYLQNHPQTFQPTKPASAVIEVPGGFVQKNNLSVGDILKFVNI